MKQRPTHRTVLVPAVLLLAIGLVGPVIVLAQPPPPGEQQQVFDEEITVQEVLLDVLVTDGGEVVTGLGPDDFWVEEGSKKFKVVSAVFYGDVESLEAKGEARSDRYFILFFHNRHRDNQRLLPAQADAGIEATRWVERETLPNDQIAVLSYERQAQSAPRLHARQGRGGRGSARRADWEGRQGCQGDRGSRAGSRQPVPASQPPRERTAATQRDGDLPACPGSRGARVGGNRGAQEYDLFQPRLRRQEPPGNWVPDTRFYPSMMESLNAADVAVYSIDLWTYVNGGATSFGGMTRSLSSISNDTSGVFYTGFTRFSMPMTKISNDNRGYYLISYETGYPIGETGYRKVKVGTSNTSYTVRHRQGYLYGSGDS